MADSSLDDIIQQKRQQRFGNQGGAQKNFVKKNFNKKQGQGQNLMNKGRLYKDVQKDLGITTGKPLSITSDARNRIIQKQRGKFRDARDRLAHLAKQGDARDKLNQIRKNPTQIRKVNPMAVRKAIPQQKTAVVKKQINNVPKQTLRAGQTRIKGNALVRTVAGGNINRKNIINKGNKVVVKKVVQQINRPQRVNQVQRSGRPQFTVKNAMAARGRNIGQLYEAAYDDVTDYGNQIQIVPRTQPFAYGMGVPSPLQTVLTTRQEPLLRNPPLQTVVYEQDYVEEIRPSRMRITAANSNYRISNQMQAQPQVWTHAPRIQPARNNVFDEQVEYQVYPKKVAAVPAARAPIDRGTKVVVSNLHPCVSVEDMEELFGTVGQISSVQMVRQGVAEAIFLNQQDAYKSVDMFNNRQLDGQPMRVVVVKTKTPLMTTTSAQSRSVLKSARGHTGYYV